MKLLREENGRPHKISQLWPLNRMLARFSINLGSNRTVEGKQCFLQEDEDEREVFQITYPKQHQIHYENNTKNPLSTYKTRR